MTCDHQWIFVASWGACECQDCNRPMGHIPTEELATVPCVLSWEQWIERGPQFDVSELREMLAGQPALDLGQ